MEDIEGLNLQTCSLMPWLLFWTCSHSFPDDSKGLVSGCRSLYRDFDEISDLCQMLNFCKFAIKQSPPQACTEKPLSVKG